MTETQAEQPSTSDGLIDRLRGEIAAAPSRSLQGILLHEVGVLHENAGEEPLAARDYLAAYNADAEFREPLEALVRILSRRRSFKNLGKLLDAMAKNAPTADERARALREVAVVALEHDKDKDEARARLEEAVTENPDEMAAWLELEMLASETGDDAAVMRAIEARLPLIGDATYKALLYIQLAELAAKVGQTSRAYEHLDAAAALEGRARFQTRLVLERIAQAAADIDAMARALEGQAELVAEVLDDPDRGEEIGVPGFMRTPAFAADAWLRAAEIRRRLGELDVANTLLSQAARRLPESSVVARARLSTLEVSGDLEAAAAIARVELERGGEGPNASVVGASAAALWLRVAEAAALANDRTAALDALRRALTEDPGAIPARAIEIDLLIDGQDPAALAGAIEGCASSFTTDQAKARAFLLAGYVWACLARDAQAAQAALSRAAALGIEPQVTLRFSRAFAYVIRDHGVLEVASEQLLSASRSSADLGPNEAAEAASLLFELGRSRLLAGDTKGAEEAFIELAQVEGVGPLARSQWLGRMLSACATGLTGAQDDSAKQARSPLPMDALAAAETDPLLARALGLVAAVRAAQGGDQAGAISRLTSLYEAAPGDEIVAIYLSELLRSDGKAASAVLIGCADALEDAAPDARTENGELAAALRLEAALLAWSAGDRAVAVMQFEAARSALPGPAGALGAWARRGLDPSTLEGRRAALAAASDTGDRYVLALERFGLEAFAEGGDAEEALAALEIAESAPAEHDVDGSDALVWGDVAIAAALGRVVWNAAFANRDAALSALDRIETRGGDATTLARAERLRIARDVDGDAAASTVCAQQWAEVEPELHVALEWLAAAVAAEDRASEAEARRLIANNLEGAAAEAMNASALIVNMLDQPGVLFPLMPADHAPGKLLNLELAPPGCDVRRRAAALHGLGDALGGDAQIDALLLAGYSDLAAGRAQAAIDTFKSVVDARPDDLAGWEGVRAAAEQLDQPVDVALACAQLGALCKDDSRGAQFWEHAGLLLLERTTAHDDAEIALDRAFSRDPRASRAFDKLFRRVRERKDNERLLSLIERRLDVAEDEREIAKLFWERARVLQKRGDNDGALAALENVTMLEPDHVGALALSGTICIQKGDFAGAAPLMARLSQNKEAPRQERLVSGITACDIYETKLNQPERALEVLIALHKDDLSTTAVRERLARAAARTGAWHEATGMLETLMVERDTSAGRVEAARLSMAIWRDKVKDPASAKSAAQKLLEESPDDPEALELVLQTSFDDNFRTQMLARGKQRLVDSLQRDPCDADRVSLLARIAAAQGDLALRQAALGVLVALGKPDRGISEELAALDTKIPGRPHTTLDARALAEIADPNDTGPVPRMLVVIAETVSAALGPSLESLNVTKKQRVDAKGGPPLRLAVAEWMGALGFNTEFELYVGGPDPKGVQGVVVGEVPALVIGPEVTTPLDSAARSGLAREVFALRRGIFALRRRDDDALASVVIAVCNEVEAPMQNPGFALYGEIARAVHKHISRKVKKAAHEVAAEVARSGQDPKAWAAFARQSLDRMAAIAAGDVSLVLADILGQPRTQLSSLVRENERALTLLRFVLSPGYLELRRKLGMGVR